MKLSTALIYAYTRTRVECSSCVACQTSCFTHEVFHALEVRKTVSVSTFVLKFQMDLELFLIYLCRIEIV